MNIAFSHRRTSSCSWLFSLLWSAAVLAVASCASRWQPSSSTTSHPPCDGVKFTAPATVVVVMFCLGYNLFR